MDHSLRDFLFSKNYIRVKLKLTKTNHFEIKALINNIRGVFILDTGASNSCVGIHLIDKFKMTAKTSKVLASGVGSNNMTTQTSKNNTLTFGRLKTSQNTLVLFDLHHINTALTNQGAQPVDGVIGADLLKKTKGIIDYEQKFLYLKKQTKNR